MNRRSFVRRLLATGAAAAVGKLALPEPAPAPVGRVFARMPITPEVWAAVQPRRDAYIAYMSRSWRAGVHPDDYIFRANP